MNSILQPVPRTYRYCNVDVLQSVQHVQNKAHSGSYRNWTVSLPDNHYLSFRLAFLIIYRIVCYVSCASPSDQKCAQLGHLPVSRAKGPHFKLKSRLRESYYGSKKKKKVSEQPLIRIFVHTRQMLFPVDCHNTPFHCSDATRNLQETKTGWLARRS